VDGRDLGFGFARKDFPVGKAHRFRHEPADLEGVGADVDVLRALDRVLLEIPDRVEPLAFVFRR
jgi:hypothetical protein